MNNKKSFPTHKPRSNLPWSAWEQQVVRMQKQITHACQRGDKEAVHTLQQRLMESEAARLLAVRRVTEENQGRHTAGVDGVKSLDAKERLAMATLIHPRNWKQQSPMPVKRVWIPKPGTTEQRPLAILPMIDRCKQALVKLALEPEWETQFEEHSYGFRPGRGTHDAITAILVAIEGHPMYVCNTDIEGAFDFVNQAVVLQKLQTYPALNQLIHAWLTAGVMDGNTYAPSPIGIAQGGILSPLLMNVALHGMEAVVANGVQGSHNAPYAYAIQQPLLIRYADNFVILHPNLQILQEAVSRVRHWLATIGLQLHAEKTHITHTLTPYEGQVGFDFLGFTIWQEGVGQTRHDVEPRFIDWGQTKHDVGPRFIDRGQQRQPSRVKTMVLPEQEASKRHIAAIEQKLRRLQNASQAQVIKELNPLIAGWTSYYNGIVPPFIMGQYDDLIEQKLLHWASKRHPGQQRAWLLTRYWHPVGSIGKRKNTFATHDGIQLRAYRQASIL